MDKKDEKKHPDNASQPMSKPDPETLHTTDPQEHMEGPISSIMQGIKEEGDKKKGNIPEDAQVEEKK